nr:immunoglobulin heavy chain junction region [Macaca mulatta]MOV48957.1 immunoglobulin heavy chain junction region [Macaca mulatta]MOV48979.1 immunoglobulin heavy chain junction region [Macaca mulatta]MOV49159.1 immunoglobulin heavy chain junction region [Macaca mulatta]MOV49193.1 immunoglobulin heavy chain junction region [Macaca mulatta]
CTRGPESDVW